MAIRVQDAVVVEDMVCSDQCVMEFAPLVFRHLLSDIGRFLPESGSSPNAQRHVWQADKALLVYGGINIESA